MARLRARITKVLDDGTEVVLVDIEDHPHYVKYVLQDAVKRIRDTAPPREELPGQMEMELT